MARLELGIEERLAPEYVSPRARACSRRASVSAFGGRPRFFFGGSPGDRSFTPPVVGKPGGLGWMGGNWAARLVTDGGPSLVYGRFPNCDSTVRDASLMLPAAVRPRGCDGGGCCSIW